MLKILNDTKAQPVLGVLFDLDGVVIDTEKLYTRFWREAAEELGHPMTLEQALQMRSLGRGPSQEKLDSFFGAGCWNMMYSGPDALSGWTPSSPSTASRRSPASGPCWPT